MSSVKSFAEQPNGDVMVMTGDTLFLVNISVLAGKSALLQDAFERVLQDNGRCTENPPVLNLHNVTPTAFRCMLNYCYTGEVVPRVLGSCHFEVLYYQIKTARQFQMQPLLEDAVKLLKRYLPDSYHFYRSSMITNATRVDANQAVIGLTIARMVGDQSLLPAALLACAQVPSVYLHNGTTLSDGTHLSIPIGDLLLYYQARATLLRATRSVIHQVFDPVVCLDCTLWRAEICNQILCCLTFNAMKRLERGLSPGFAQPFGIWARGELAGCSEPWVLCGACEEMVLQRERDILRAMWIDLPCTLNVVVAGWSGNSCRRHCVNPTVGNTCRLRA